MCSIGGWYAWGKARPSVNVVKGLLTAGATHGGTVAHGSNDATGVAYLGQSGKITLAKDSLSAKDFTGGFPADFWQELANSPRALLHNRARTKGTINQASNHPLPYYGYAVIHNGTISNDDDLFDFFKVDRPADVDSVAINLVLSQGKDLLDGLRHLSTIGGGCSTAIWKADDIDRIALARFGNNDFYLWMDEQDDILYWSSAYSAAIFMRVRKLGSLRFQSVTRMPDERIIVLAPTKEKVRTFSLKRRPFTLSHWEREKLRKSTVASKSPTPSSGDTAGTPSSSATPSSTSSPTATSASTGPSSTALATLPVRTSTRITGVEVARSGDDYWTFPNREGFKYGYKWERRGEKMPILADKPAPLWEYVLPKWNYLGELYGELLKDTGPKYDSFNTVYGTWHFNVLETDGGKRRIWREFKPIKRMKPYLHNAFGKCPTLPLVRLKDELLPQYDNKLPLEYFEVIEIPTGGVGTRIYKPGYMCPVCGVTAPEALWTQQKFVCSHCELHLLLLAKGE